MVKELEAFEEIIDKFAEQMIRANKEELTATNKTNAIEYLYRTPQVRLLNETLQRLESIDNANPSEALKNLEELNYNLDLTKTTTYINHYHNIKQALIKSQEQEKVLKILKENNVDIGLLMNCATLDEYCYHYSNSQLIPQEFDLLKAYFGKNIQK